MKNLFLSIIMIFIAFLSTAQNDKKAKDILDGVRDKTSSFEAISAEFVFSLENKEMDIFEKNEGNIVLKGQKYMVNIPELGVEVFSDGTTLWNYMKDGNQVTVSDIEENSSELMDPSSVFTIYERGFKSKFVGENSKNSGVENIVELYPDSGEHEVTKIVLSIGKYDKMIKSALLYGTDGNIYGIEIKGIDTSRSIPDSFFIFNTSEYKDIEVIDFR